MECAEENYRKFGVEANNVSIRSGLTTLAVKPKEFVNAFRYVQNSTCMTIEKVLIF